jgi:hypothetical protein
MADLEFFLDPGCPFAWITSRWVTEVSNLRQYDVTWRFISLKFLNEHRTDEAYTSDYGLRHATTHTLLRVIAAAGAAHGNAAVARLYTEIGTRYHAARRSDEARADVHAFAVEALTAAGLPVALADELSNDRWDALLRSETNLALDRTGRDVGTPILTFLPGSDKENSFFGPVISKAPRGDDAVRLWDAVETIATTSSMSELKRSSRAALDFT